MVKGPLRGNKNKPELKKTSHEKENENEQNLPQPNHGAQLSPLKDKQGKLSPPPIKLPSIQSRLKPTPVFIFF